MINLNCTQVLPTLENLKEKTFNFLAIEGGNFLINLEYINFKVESVGNFKFSMKILGDASPINNKELSGNLNINNFRFDGSAKNLTHNYFENIKKK